MRINIFNISKVFGKRVTEELGDIINKIYGFYIDNRVFTIFSPSSYRIAKDKVINGISKYAEEVEIEITSDRCTSANVEKMVNRCREKKANLIIGVGGGSIIDLAKIVADRCNARSISIPTILSTNALASPFSVIWSDGGSEAVRTKPPLLVLGDLDILLAQDRRFISAGLGELLAKITSVNDWMISREAYDPYLAYIARSLLRLTLMNMDNIIKMGEDGIERLFDLLIMDGLLMELAGTTRIVAGCEHLIAFGIEIISKKGLHGEQVAIGTLICSYFQGLNWRRVRNILKRAGLPTSAYDIGLSENDIVDAVSIAPTIRKWHTSLRAGLKKDLIEKILKKLLVI